MWFSYSDGFRDVQEKLGKATEQIESLAPGTASQRLALAFGILERGGEPLPDLLAYSIEEARILNDDVRVWHLDFSERSDVQYPGCIAIGSLIG